MEAQGIQSLVGHATFLRRAWKQCGALLLHHPYIGPPKTCSFFLFSQLASFSHRACSGLPTQTIGARKVKHCFNRGGSRPLQPASPRWCDPPPPRRKHVECRSIIRKTGTAGRVFEVLPKGSRSPKALTASWVQFTDPALAVVLPSTRDRKYQMTDPWLSSTCLPFSFHPQRQIKQ